MAVTKIPNFRGGFLALAALFIFITHKLEHGGLS
jgi:hypothetical protein